MSGPAIEARLHASGCSKAIRLGRGPRFLRFVVRGDDWSTLDALDQPDDAPADGERVIAAEMTSSSRMHIRGVRNHKTYGEWLTMVNYAPVTEQPPQDVMADYERWKAWCVGVANREKGVTE